MKRSAVSRAPLALACLALLPALSWAGDEPGEETRFPVGRTNLGYAPFDSVSLSPFSSLRPGFLPAMPATLAGSCFEARLTQSWAKVISSGADWLIDYEVLRTSATFGYGISDLLSLELEVDANERVPGGALQRLILAFHRTFDIKSSYLTPYPAAYYRFEAAPPGGGHAVDLREHDRQPFVAGGLASLRQTLTWGDDWVPACAAALSLRGDLVQHNLRGGSPVDLAASAFFSKGAGPVVFYAGADLEWYGSESLPGIPLRPLQWSILGAVEWRCLPRFSIVAQYLLKRGAIERLGDFSVPSNEITAGFKWELGRGALLGVAVLENVVNPYNTPDFGLHAELAFRW
jgi:Protein of unknown function (DUF3187)